MHDSLSPLFCTGMKHSQARPVVPQSQNCHETQCKILVLNAYLFAPYQAGEVQSASEDTEHTVCCVA